MDPDDLARALSALADLPADDPVRLRIERVAESLVRDGRRARQRERREERRARDREVLAASATGALDRREDAPLSAADSKLSLISGASGADARESAAAVGSGAHAREPAPNVGSSTDAREAAPAVGSVGTLLRPHRCYVCKQLYSDVSAFYHQLCPTCAAENLAWRQARTPLDGRTALVTGGRVKIGFQVALMLLRDGASVRVATRFPHDAVRRFRAVEDSPKWLDRLSVTGIDLRDPRQVIELCDQLVARGEPLDILINNAAQTVRRPEASYAPLIEAERRAALELGSGALKEIAGIRGFSEVAPSADISGFSEVAPIVDENGLLPDHSPTNSWSAELGHLDPVEVLEVHLVNAVAPALLADRLLPLMLAAPAPRRYIVNVTAVEGRFEVRNKTAGHPHTNMAKAALNMLTRTSADRLARQGVYLSSVDTGWITDEKPMPRKLRHAANGFRTPLDIIDGAARIYHPIVSGEAGEPLYGAFLKDYRAVAW